jgi:ribosome-binding ATPase YchF (GTP1/OBG family)
MESEKVRKKLMKEAQELQIAINKYNLTDERKLQRIELLHRYNDTKDSALVILSALAELEQLSIKDVANKLNIFLEE